MRFTMILFLGLVLMTMNASGKPKFYIAVSADSGDIVQKPKLHFPVQSKKIHDGVPPLFDEEPVDGLVTKVGLIIAFSIDLHR